MVETPRAALRAGEIAEHSAFLSFGTNDLTQMTYGLSRDDAGRFMSAYVQQGVFEEDPFQQLDLDGVGELLSARGGAGAFGTAGRDAVDVRRACGASRFDRVLPPCGLRLCQLFALPGAGGENWPRHNYPSRTGIWTATFTLTLTPGPDCFTKC